MSIIFQFIGSLLLVLNQVFRSKKSLILEQKSIMPQSANLTPTQAKSIIWNHTVNTLGFIYLLVGYIIQLFNVDERINLILHLNVLWIKTSMVFFILTISFCIVKILSRLLYKKVLKIDQKGFPGVVNIYVTNNLDDN